MNERQRILTRLEIICGVAWFFDDGFWLMQWRLPCYTACLIAFVAAIFILRNIEKRPVPLLVCCADTCWLVLNIFWSIGDLEGIEPLNIAAKVLFFVGIGFFAAACLFAEKLHDTLSLVLGRLRFFHFR